MNYTDKVAKATSSVLTYNQIESKRAFDQAARDGDRVVLPNPNQLLIDIDNEEAMVSFHRQFQRFTELIDENAVVTYDGPSRSGEEGHRHIIVDMYNNIDPKERILYQLMLGSDLRRELLSFVRVMYNDEHPTLFIEKGQKLLPAPVEETANEELCGNLDLGI